MLLSTVVNSVMNLVTSIDSMTIMNATTLNLSANMTIIRISGLGWEACQSEIALALCGYTRIEVHDN